MLSPDVLVQKLLAAKAQIQDPDKWLQGQLFDLKSGRRGAWTALDQAAFGIEDHTLDLAEALTGKRSPRAVIRLNDENPHHVVMKAFDKAIKRQKVAN